MSGDFNSSMYITGWGTAAISRSSEPPPPSAEEKSEVDSIFKDADKKGIPSHSIPSDKIKKALGVLTREAVYVRAGEMIDRQEITHIGTNSLLPCIGTFIYHPGNETNPPSAAVLHIDPSADINKSLDTILRLFPDNENLTANLLSSKGHEETAWEITRHLNSHGVPVDGIALRGSSEYLIDVQTGMVDTSPETTPDLDFGKGWRERLDMTASTAPLKNPTIRPHNNDIQRAPALDVPTPLQ